jgi:hypothetical protein
LIDFDWIAAARAYQRNPQWLTLGELAVARGLISHRLLVFIQEHQAELSALPDPQALRDRLVAAGLAAPNGLERVA